MKKATTVLLTLLALSVIATGEFVNFANANFAPAFSFPEEPDYTPPSIMIHTPIQNETYNTTDSKTILNLRLNITVVKNTIGPLLSFWYTLDDNEKVFINVNDKDDPFNSNSVLKFTSLLHVECGLHSLKIGIQAKSYYVTYDAQHGWTWPSVMLDAESEPITFTVAPMPTPTSAPTQTQLTQTQNQPTLNPTTYLLLISLVAVAIVAPILLYRKHKKQQSYP